MSGYEMIAVFALAMIVVIGFFIYMLDDDYEDD